MPKRLTIFILLYGALVMCIPSIAIMNINLSISRFLYLGLIYYLVTCYTIPLIIARYVIFGGHEEKATGTLIHFRESGGGYLTNEGTSSLPDTYHDTDKAGREAIFKVNYKGKDIKLGYIGERDSQYFESLLNKEIDVYVNVTKFGPTWVRPMTVEKQFEKSWKRVVSTVNMFFWLMFFTVGGFTLTWILTS